MGYLLYFEGMFYSILEAKKKYLKQGGQLFPDKSSISIAGVYNKDFNSLYNETFD